MSKLMRLWKSSICYQIKAVKWYQFIGFIWVSFSHPFYILGGYYLALFEYATRHWNDSQGEFISVNPVVFSLILIIIAELRFQLFCKWHRSLQLTHQQLVTRFIKVNWWNFPWVVVYFSLLGQRVMLLSFYLCLLFLLVC